MIEESSSDMEKSTGWHKTCIRKFFGTSDLPDIAITDARLSELANESVNRGLTVPGVQKKLSLHLETMPQARLTLVNYPTGYILKPQTTEYAFLPEYEQMTMLMAEAVGIRTVPHALIRMDHSLAYITRRIDRILGRDQVQFFAMEDFCQLSGRLTEDKYKGSYENCGRIIRRYSRYPGFDLSELFLRVIFSFVTGNSDMHLKNFSMIEERPASRTFRLSEAYDMLPVNLVLPEDKDEMALTVHGKKRNIHRKDFLIMAESCGLSHTAAEHLMNLIASRQGRLLEEADHSFLPDDQKAQMKELIQNRIKILMQTGGIAD